MAETYAEYSLRIARAYALRLLEKPLATAEELAMFRRVNNGRSQIRVNPQDDTFKVLDNEEVRDRLDAVERDAMRLNVMPFWNFTKNEPEGFGTLPGQIDHRPNQTPIKDQKDRGTCVCFASVAAIESLIKTQQNIDVDLSEQLANWIFQVLQADTNNICNDGLRATLAARYLSIMGVCPEEDFPYEDKKTVLQHCDLQPSAKALANAKFRVDGFAVIDGSGLNGPTINNTDYLESILTGANNPARARDIVFGTEVAWGKADEQGILDIIRDEQGNLLKSAGGHAMLIVGYDKTGSKPFFIMKNSWGTVTPNGKPVGHDGYFFMSYDYVRNYGKYGFIIKKLRLT